MKNILTFFLILITSVALAQSKKEISGNSKSKLLCGLEFPFVYNEDSIAGNRINKIVIDEYANRKNWKKLRSSNMTFHYLFDTLGQLTEPKCDSIHAIDKYDFNSRLIESISISQPVESATQVTSTQYFYDTSGKLISMCHKYGHLSYNYNKQINDTIYKSVSFDKIIYEGNRIATVLNGLKSLDDDTPYSKFNYLYLPDGSYQVELYIVEEKKIIYLWNVKQNKY